MRAYSTPWGRMGGMGGRPAPPLVRSRVPLSAHCLFIHRYPPSRSTYPAVPCALLGLSSVVVGEVVSLPPFLVTYLELNRHGISRYARECRVLLRLEWGPTEDLKCEDGTKN